MLAFKLRRQEEALRSSNEQVEQLRSEIEKFEKSKAETEVLETITRDESATLRKRLDDLEQRHVQQLEKISVERDSLRQSVAALQSTIQAERNASSTRITSSPRSQAQNDKSNPTEEEKFEAKMCAAHLHQIGKAVGQWAMTHDNRAPVDFISLKEFLSPMILLCPSARQAVYPYWDKFDPSLMYYRILSPGMEWKNGPSRIFVQCRLHETAILNHGGPGIPSKYVR